MELTQTLDDAWNAQVMKVFGARHRHNVVVTLVSFMQQIGLSR